MIRGIYETIHNIQIIISIHNLSLTFLASITENAIRRKNEKRPMPMTDIFTTSSFLSIVSFSPIDFLSEMIFVLNCSCSYWLLSALLVCSEICKSLSSSRSHSRYSESSFLKSMVFLAPVSMIRAIYSYSPNMFLSTSDAFWLASILALYYSISFCKLCVSWLITFFVFI